jgi:hypothetical protein
LNYSEYGGVLARLIMIRKISSYQNNKKQHEMVSLERLQIWGFNHKKAMLINTKRQQNEYHSPAM